MKRVEVISFVNALYSLDLKGYNKFLLFAIDKAKTELRSVAQEVIDRDRSRILESTKLIEEKRIAIVKEYAEKDELGEYVISNNSYVIPDDKKAIVSEKIAALREENKDAMEAQVKSDSDFEEYMSEEIDPKFVKISFKNLPDVLDDSVYQILSKFVRETPEEIAELI